LVLLLNQLRALLTLAAISILVIGMLPAQSFALEYDKIEIEVEIKDGISKIEIETVDFEDEFVLDTTDEEKIIAEIMERVDLSADQIRDIWKFEFEHDDEFEREDKFENENEFDYYEEHDKEFDGVYYDDVDREHDYEYDRERDMRGEECIVEEDQDVIVGDEACLLKVFDEIPKQNCIKSTEDGLVFYEKECIYKHKDKRYHDGPSDSKSQRIIHELQEENRFLKEKIHELEQQIKDLNQLLREQLRVIYEWIINR